MECVTPARAPGYAPLGAGPRHAEQLWHLGGGGGGSGGGETGRGGGITRRVHHRRAVSAGVGRAGWVRFVSTTVGRRLTPLPLTQEPRNPKHFNHKPLILNPKP